MSCYQKKVGLLLLCACGRGIIPCLAYKAYFKFKNVVNLIYETSSSWFILRCPAYDIIKGHNLVVSLHGATWACKIIIYWFSEIEG